MPCGCATRAGKLLRWLGYTFEPPERWRLRGSSGTVVLDIDAAVHHFRITVVALVARVMVGRAPDGV